MCVRVALDISHDLLQAHVRWCASCASDYAKIMLARKTNVPIVYGSDADFHQTFIFGGSTSVTNVCECIFN